MMGLLGKCADFLRGKHHAKYRVVCRMGRAAWSWRIVHVNGHVLAHSEDYSSKGKCLQTAKELCADAAWPLVVEGAEGK